MATAESLSNLAQRGRSEQIRIPAATPEQKSVGKDSDLPPAIAKLSQAADGRRSGHNSEFVPVLGLFLRFQRAAVFSPETRNSKSR